MRKSKGTTPKSRARALLLEKYGRRGSHNSNLWLYYSPKTKLDWVVASDDEFDHAIWLEALPDVVRFDLNPPELIVKVGSDDHKTQFDAHVWFRETGPEAREIKAEAEEEHPVSARTIHQREAQLIAAQQLGAARRVITAAQMKPHALLIANWRRIVAFMSATRDYPMAEFDEMAALKLHATQTTTLGSLLDTVPEESHPPFLSAIFSLHQAGLYKTDLDRAPLSRSTRIWREDDER